MAIYAIGDVQGCYDPLQRLLDLIGFDATQDTLWFCGDLVNRGAQSIAVLRLVKSLGEHAITVLGNHDLHLLAVAHNSGRYRRQDTFKDVLEAADREELLTWLRHQPLLHHDTVLKTTLVHAGLAPQWSVPKARALATEVETVLRSPTFVHFFSNMYGDEPLQWCDALTDWPRLRFITNTLTRIRFSDHQGGLILSEKGEVGSQPPGYLPWFEIPTRQSRGEAILFGHWAALGASCHGDAWSLDSGCAWGGGLSALRVDGVRCYYHVDCR